MSLKAGFAAVRKPKKLPYKSRSVTYELEYGSDTLGWWPPSPNESMKSEWFYVGAPHVFDETLP
jgi:hypothetical protein